VGAVLAGSLNWGNAGMTWLDALGWAWSALLVYSVLQTRILRFRIFNGIASVLLVVFNASIAVWPMVGLVKLMRGRHDPRSYSVVDIDPADAYVQYMLLTVESDIRHFNPKFFSADAGGSGFGFLILTGPRPSASCSPEMRASGLRRSSWITSSESIGTSHRGSLFTAEADRLCAGAIRR
jgi:hypothetical protein